MERPLCFVLMPFGTKRDPVSGLDIDFDRIYDQAIRPGIEAAGLEPIRADEERTGGVIHKAMFERLLLCEYALADLTTANANVFYELGVRHAVRPATTLAIYAKDRHLAFDVNYLRALPYALAEGNRFGLEEASRLKFDLARKLEDLRSQRGGDPPADSPVFQLLPGYGPPDIQRLKTDVFRERARYAAGIKNELARARAARDRERIRELRASLGNLGEVESGVLVDLYLSLRAVSDWAGMVELYEALPEALRRTVLVREQLGFALNRLERRDEAARVLEEVLEENGPSSETLGLLGRVHKDRWADALRRGEHERGRGYLELAIDAYVRGFETDIRDAYPGINALTLLDIHGGQRELALQRTLLPVVRFAVELRLRSGKPDYWDHATLLELALLADAPAEEVAAARAAALASVREDWEPASTANNLRLIREARLDSQRDVGALDASIEALDGQRSVRFV